MKLLLIFLAQSPTGAVITIIALLLVAVIIGYLTAWFYAKSVYTPVIKKLEAEKADLLNQVAGLKNDVSRLNVKVEELNGKIVRLEEDAGKLREEISKKEKELKDLRIKVKE